MNNSIIKSLPRKEFIVFENTKKDWLTSTVSPPVEPFPVQWICSRFTGERAVRPKSTWLIRPTRDTSILSIGNRQQKFLGKRMSSRLLLSQKRKEKPGRVERTQI